ncbi:Hypothetical predicted protein [Mytilus galloprovincialis]|uniref:Uncharacterized protein n=1 Tax=Mytilus galloprovincialis TaxID=29158 RepID=A0A8B6HR74_MYTGA|nr:Hypothetical predicted protein [Mytilus galloprovincialis]
MMRFRARTFMELERKAMKRKFEEKQKQEHEDFLKKQADERKINQLDETLDRKPIYELKTTQKDTRKGKQEKIDPDLKRKENDELMKKQAEDMTQFRRKQEDEKKRVKQDLLNKKQVEELKRKQEG